MSAIERLINVCENRQVADTATTELATLRAELEAAHKSDGLNIDRIRELSAELAQVQVDYQVALKQGAEQARIAGNWQVDHIKLEAELEECRGEREQLSYQKKMLLKDTQEVVSKLEAERDTLKQSHAKLLEDYENANAEADTLKGENERLGGIVSEMCEALDCSEPHDDFSPIHELKRVIRGCEVLYAERDSHRLLLDEMGFLLGASQRRDGHEYYCSFDVNGHDTRTDFCNCRKDRVQAALAKYQQQCGEKVKV